MRFEARLITAFMILSSFISLSAFSSVRQSAYEKFIYSKAIREGKTPPSVYPFNVESQDTNGLDCYESWIAKKGLIDRSFSTETNFLLEAGLTGGYSKDGFSGSGKINARASFALTDRIHASVSALLDSDTSKSSFYRAKPFKDAVAAAFDVGYIQYSKRGFDILLGRTYTHSSYDIGSSMIYSYDAPSMDGALMNFSIGAKVKYVFRWAYLEHMMLDSAYSISGEEHRSIDRFLSFHKITYSPFDFLSFSFGESVVYGRVSPSGALDYAFPFFLYYAEQENASVNDNIMWDFSADLNISGRANLSYTLFVDDYQYEKEDIYDLEPPQLGHGFRADFPYGSGNVSVSVYRINAWVYNQMFEWNRYALRGVNIGYQGAPDVLSVKVSVEQSLCAKAMISAEAGYLEKGDNSTYDDWIFPTSNTYYQNTEIGIEPVSREAFAGIGVESALRIFIPSLSAGLVYSITDGSVSPSLSAGLRIFI